MKKETLLSIATIFFLILLYGSVVRADDKRPNILVILVDDLGYADIGLNGGEIPTHNIDNLANEGIHMTRFYASLICSPSRAMLMSGVSSHLAGLGTMAEMLRPGKPLKPGFEGYLNPETASIAELMKDAGYKTYMTGKWHLGIEPDQTPHARGFDRSFVLLTGSADHFNELVGPTLFEPVAKYAEDGDYIYHLPDTFYSSDFYTDKMLEYIKAGSDDDAPFFGYLAFTAPHFPMQAPINYLNRFRGRYDMGYDVLRQQRFEKLKKLGRIPQDAKAPPRAARIPAWTSLSAEEQKYQSRLMEVYAAMVANMDHNIGRVIKYLKRTGQYDNTMIIFLSDNGADGYPMEDIPAYRNWVKHFDNSYENIGKKGSFTILGQGWASAGAAPFRLFKGYPAEGGIRVPAIVVFPNKTGAGTTNDSMASILDIMPTLLEAAKTTHPGNLYANGKRHYPSGVSLVKRTGGKSKNENFGIEMGGQRGFVSGPWKLLKMPPPLGNGTWELFNVDSDPGETTDLSQKNQAVMQKLVAEWQNYAEKNNISP